MNNADQKAFGSTYQVGEILTVEGGLTKREIFAMHFHAALLTATDADGGWSGQGVGAAKSAVAEADALLKELEK